LFPFDLDQAARIGTRLRSSSRKLGLYRYLALHPESEVVSSTMNVRLRVRQEDQDFLPVVAPRALAVAAAIVRLGTTACDSLTMPFHSTHYAICIGP